MSNLLSLQVMLVLVFILLSINDTTIAHTTTIHDQGNGIAKLGVKEVYDGHYVPASVKVIDRGRKEKEGNKMTQKDFKKSVATKWERKMRMLQSKLSFNENVDRASLMDFNDADYGMPTTHPPRHN